MKTVVRKIFFNFEKEEKWLNEMAAKGLHLVHYSIAKYVFEKGEPGEYIYRLELLDQLALHPESKAYIQFMGESGVECVSAYGRWVFFRKKASEGTFDLFTNNESLMAHYKKILVFMGTLGGINLLIAIMNLINGFFGLGGNHSLGYFSLLNWAVVALFTPIVISYWKTYHQLKKDKDLFE